MTLLDSDIEKDQLSKSLLIPGSGKILKVAVRFEDDLDTGVTLRISTKEGEEIINVKSDKPNEIYYPRSNITTQRYNENTMLEESQTSLDYYFFSGGLLFTIEKDNASSEMKLIRKIVLLYDDLS